MKKIFVFKIFLGVFFLVVYALLTGQGVSAAERERGEVCDANSDSCLTWNGSTRTACLPGADGLSRCLINDSDVTNLFVKGSRCYADSECADGTTCEGMNAQDDPDGNRELAGSCTEAEEAKAGMNAVEPLLDEDFNAFNPLLIAKKVDGSAVDPKELSTLGGIISRVLLFAFPLAGLILFVMISWGGFEMLYGASTSKAMEAGRQRVTAALIGFFLLFASYWIIQILEVVFGIGILK